VSEAIEDVIESRLFGTAFERLLNALDPNHERAGERYLDLSLKLRNFFVWKGCRESDADDLVDETLDRLAKKLGEGKIVVSINAYAHGIAKNVLFEYSRNRIEKSLEEDPPEIPIPETQEESDKRYECLEKCLAKLKSADREQIIGYYDVEENEKNKHRRKRLAEQFNKTALSLKVHTTRLREKLRKCINSCAKREVDVTKLSI
jgi:RNA polymerase sigma factor (sigma-70 family)